jgi:hypothetical protein
VRKLIAAMKLSVDGMADWLKAWSDDYGLTPQMDTCVVGGGRYPGYQQYRTSIQSEPGKPVWITGIAPTPAEIDWARFAARAPDCVPSSTLTSALAKDTFRRNP